MIIRHCMQLLLELSRLEEKLAKVQQTSPETKKNDKEIIERHLKKIQPLS